MTHPVIPVRIDEAQKAAFIRLCRERDTTASREIRAFIRSYLERYGKKGEQSELF